MFSRLYYYLYIIWNAADAAHKCGINCTTYDDDDHFFLFLWQIFFLVSIVVLCVCQFFLVVVSIFFSSLSLVCSLYYKLLLPPCHVCITERVQRPVCSPGGLVYNYQPQTLYMSLHFFYIYFFFFFFKYTVKLFGLFINNVSISSSWYIHNRPDI